MNVSFNAFDFDKTIYKRDSTADFYFYTIARHPSALVELPATAWYFLLYKLGRRTKTQFKEVMYRFLRHTGGTEELAEKFWEEKQVGIKKWYLEMKRDDDLIISASPEFLLRPICKKLGVRLIASRVDPDTGKYEGLNCWGDEKVVRFKSDYPDCNIIEFYSDSYSDTPLAEIAERAFLVKGDRLSEFFKKR
ncbi:MAG: hypothetical protein E7546_08555 [Ruminococcaceae bacterium]|nr:hypothetical protein [Oscillospiraceae bacterium]